ncbi:xanthine dehydrogenase family protein molybdopterin-binding subunit [Actinoallomurus sp. NPDC050550]|uniref:xanthine dehydrogenase family protein molybdopterin-binding subunit n=1 Tax=Actinoallomurus sp. NPDC050550 TaxID=3154937 RepID=UPI0033F425B0
MTDARSAGPSVSSRSRYGIGAARLRVEDARHLRGQARFLADIALPGMRDAVFVRSPVAHGRLLDVRPPPDTPSGACWTAAELGASGRPVAATAALPGFRAAAYPPLATGTVRYVGEPIAMVLGDDRAAAADLADRVDVRIEALPAVSGLDQALAERPALVHESWPDNVYVRVARSFGDVEAAVRAADLSITREYRIARQSCAPLECRGVIAHYDPGMDQLVVYSATQFPHVLRDALAERLEPEVRRLRVIAPDVGGGFGAKVSLYPEELAIAAAALRCGHPIRWVESRREHLVAATQAHGHRIRVTVHASSSGAILAVEADIVADAGAYSIWPWTAAMDATMAAAMIPGPYRIRDYRFTSTTVATNKAPLGPYRGVSRPVACFAIERTVDELARRLGAEPYDLRVWNMVRPEQMPYTSVAGRVYDSGDYPEAVRQATKLIGHGAWRRRQRLTDPRERTRIGIGYAAFTEQTAHGVAEWTSRGMPITFGAESARVVLDAIGTLTVACGIKELGQGLETCLAQVVGEVFDVDPGAVAVVQGDTALTPRGDGTFSSRSIVMAGGAAHRAATTLAAKVRRVAAAMLDRPAGELRFTDGRIAGSDASITLRELARTFLLRPDRVPAEIEPGLEATCHYRPDVQTGAFTYATHAAVVEVDLDTGLVRLLDYAVVEDCGTVVNPLIVDDQIVGGVAQGIGTALLEELVYDGDGRPRATSLTDYFLPGVSDVPRIRVHHLETPSPHTVHGVKGVGESGAIAPPAAIANAVSDALAEFDAFIGEVPLTPDRVWTALRDAGNGP